MILALWRMDPAQLRAAPAGGREPGAIRAGLRYVRRTPALMVPLALMALVGTFGFNFQVVLPLLARFSFDGGAGAGLRDPGARPARRRRGHLSAAWAAHVTLGRIAKTGERDAAAVS